MTLDDCKNFAFATPLPDGNGGFSPCPVVLTEEELIRYIRLDTLGIKNPHNTLRYYRNRGLLKATKISNHNIYTRETADQFLREMTKKK